MFFLYVRSSPFSVVWIVICVHWRSARLEIERLDPLRNSSPLIRGCWSFDCLRVGEAMLFLCPWAYTACT